MQDSYGGCGFTVDIPTLPVARAIPRRRVLEHRAEGRGDNTKGCKQINQLHKEQTCLWQYFLCPGRLGLMMARDEEVPIRQGHLAQPQPGCCSPETKATSSASSLSLEPARTWSCFFNRETKMFPTKQSSPWPFFLKNLLCFHCWRKPEPCVWPQTGFPRADVLRASTHTAPRGRALGGSRQPGLHQLLSHRSMNSRWTELSFHAQQPRPCSGPWPIRLEENSGFMIKDCFPLCASPCGTTQLEQCSSFKLF